MLTLSAPNSGLAPARAFSLEFGKDDLNIKDGPLSLGHFARQHAQVKKPKQGNKHRVNASQHSTRLIDLTELVEEANRNSKGEIPRREVTLLDPEEEEPECKMPERAVGLSELSGNEEARWEEEECNVSMSDDSIGSEQPDDGEKKIPLSLPFNRGQNGSLRIKLDAEDLGLMDERNDVSEQLVDRGSLIVRNCVSRQEEVRKLPSLSPRVCA